MGGRSVEDDGASPAPAALSPGELHRYIQRGRDLRAAAMAEALARGRRLVQKRLAGLFRGAAGPLLRGRLRRAGPCRT
jgi:hypothetical protein